MIYLVCELCGGYYRLLEGESIDDFDSCQCGGNFYIMEMDDEVASFDVQTSEIESPNHVNPEVETSKATAIKHTNPEVESESSEILCNECGHLNDINTAFCSGCGQILVHARELSSINNNSNIKPKIRLFAGFIFIALSLVLLGFLF